MSPCIVLELRTMKDSDAQRQTDKRPVDKKSVQKPKKSPEKPGSFFLHKRMNWWAGLALVLPLVISPGAMNPTGPPRLILLAIFLLAFILYFFSFPAKPLRISLAQPP